MRIDTNATPGNLRARCVAAIVAKVDADPGLSLRDAARLVAVEAGNEARGKGWAPVTCEYLVRFVATVAAELELDAVAELAGASA